MNNMWKVSLFGFVMSIFMAGVVSTALDDDNETLFLSSKDNSFYGKLSVLSSTFVPTALLPLEEFSAFLDNSLLGKINPQCIEDSRHYVKALGNQSDWALSSTAYFI